MAPERIYEFRLVADAAGPAISTDKRQSARSLLVHLQPARSAKLEGNPPRSVLVVSYGGTEVAPGLLAHLERLAQVRLHVELPE